MNKIKKQTNRRKLSTNIGELLHGIYMFVFKYAYRYC